MKEIRRACIRDAKGISGIVAEVWNQSIDLEVYRSQVEGHRCAIWTAIEENEEVAGFVSAFLTIGKDQVLRWQVDLLAVRPASQGHRLGQALVGRTPGGIVSM